MTDFRPRVLLVAGYFDWFSGYQETALAEAFAKIAETEVVASDRVSPAFSDDHLARLGVARRYSPGTREEHDVTITRLPSRERRSMVWSSQARCYIASRCCDLIIQVMPGQIMSAAPSMTRNPAPRVVLYGDNRAMWSHLPRPARILKGAAFAMSKGLVYALVNKRSQAVYGYTTDTLRRLRWCSMGHEMRLLPLAFSDDRFHLDERLRSVIRTELEIPETARVLIIVGRLERRKRIEWALEAFDRLATEHGDLHLLLVGADSSPYSLEIRAAVSGAQHGERVRVLAFASASRLNAYLNAADLGIWPRNPAITIQQAMGTGLPVVLPRNDFVDHLLVEGAGSYFDASEDRGAEVIETALRTALGSTDLTPRARHQRVRLNEWLSARNVAQTLLSETVHQEHASGGTRT